ncbi:tumor necrosis factor receptor superfamily member 9 isoform X2 [Hypomesus transpacificus]|uniref:tumor necrosis factor receptor superfamily member 9 isoform X2 n=1 Tax=Hypomesus transpacificus TaxID=137520 RepID=UPI001F07D7BB|nr:tumor necrosis factor receptor superfamily member 9 isoform X2 [Hypomesus transpacificus]
MNLSGISALVTLICSFNVPGLCVAGECGKGQMIDPKKGCADCTEKTFQPTPNDSQFCKACTLCNNKHWSVEVKKCTRIMDTTCECQDGFVPTNDKSSACKCEKGSGVNHVKGQPICRKCENGFFTSEKDNYCVEWKKCSSGVRVNGSKTSDVVCNNNSEIQEFRIPPTAPPSPLTIQTRFSERPPLELTSPTFISTPSKNENGTLPSTLSLIFGLTLLVLVFLTYKFTITPCVESYKLPIVKTAQDSCRRPVEESGDSNLSSLVKSGAEEP